MPAEAFGAMLYEQLRTAVASDGALSIERLITSLGRPPEQFQDQYVGEIMIGAMFSAMLAVEQSTSKLIGDQIVAGMQSEFFRHLREQGASPGQVEEWNAVLCTHVAEYRETLSSYEGLEPPWKFGRLFLWNLTGLEEYDALAIKHATLYLVAARDYAQVFLNEQGPRIALDIPDSTQWL